MCLTLKRPVNQDISAIDCILSPACFRGENYWFSFKKSFGFLAGSAMIGNRKEFKIVEVTIMLAKLTRSIAAISVQSFVSFLATGLTLAVGIVGAGIVISVIYQALLTQF